MEQSQDAIEKLFACNGGYLNYLINRLHFITYGEKCVCISREGI